MLIHSKDTETYYSDGKKKDLQLGNICGEIKELWVIEGRKWGAVFL